MRIESQITLPFHCRCRVSSAEVRHYVSSLSTLETLQLHCTSLPPPGGIELAAALGMSSILNTLVMPSDVPSTKEVLHQVAQLSTLQKLDLSTDPVRVSLIRYPQTEMD